MRMEIYPATMREKEIPHRTERAAGGRMIISVPQEWAEDARRALAEAEQLFFGAMAKKREAPPPSSTHEAQAGQKQATAESAYEEEYGDYEEGFGLFHTDGLPSPDETHIRAVWPSWALAALPGLGLGHLWAGKVNIFFYLVFCSLLGVLFYHFTHSLWSFCLNLLSWGVDLGFAAFHVREHNRRAERARKRVAEAEREFVESL
ncbi:MAG: hypothetical protein JXR96_29155 [Deltaproteobacteria bacterium]|nr:hypothetical protein [Deltaproteobacteria bacterium]